VGIQVARLSNRDPACPEPAAESDGKRGLALPRVIERTLDRRQPVAAIEQRQPARYLSGREIGVSSGLDIRGGSYRLPG
jgi:hypothetical protein